MGFAETGGEIFEGLAKETAAGVSRNAVEGAGKLFMQALFEPKKARRRLARLSTILFFPQLIRRLYSRFLKDPNFVIDWKVRQTSARIQQENESVEQMVFTQWANALRAADLAIERAKDPAQIESVRQRREALEKETEEKIKAAEGDEEAIRKIQENHRVQNEIIDRDSVEGAIKAKERKIRELEISGGGTYEEQLRQVYDLRDARLQDLMEVSEFIKKLPCGIKGHDMIEKKYNDPSSPDFDLVRYVMALSFTETRQAQRGYWVAQDSRKKEKIYSGEVKDIEKKLNELRKKDISEFEKRAAVLSKEKDFLEKNIEDLNKKLKATESIEETRKLNSRLTELKQLLNGGTTKGGKPMTGVANEFHRNMKVVNDHNIEIKKLERQLYLSKNKLIFQQGFRRLRARQQFKMYIQNKPGSGLSKVPNVAVSNLEGNIADSAAQQRNFLAARGNITLDPTASIEEQMRFYNRAGETLENINTISGSVPYRVHLSQNKPATPKVDVEVEMPETSSQIRNIYHNHHYHSHNATDPFFDLSREGKVRPWAELGASPKGKKDFSGQTSDSGSKTSGKHKTKKQLKSVGTGTGDSLTHDEAKRVKFKFGKRGWKSTPIAITPGIPNRGGSSNVNPYGASRSDIEKGVVDITKKGENVDVVFVPLTEKKSEEIYVRHSGDKMKKQLNGKLADLENRAQKALKNKDLSPEQEGLLKDVLGQVVKTKKKLKNTGENDIPTIAAMLFSVDEMLKMFTKGTLGLAVPGIRPGSGEFESHQGSVLD